MVARSRKTRSLPELYAVRCTAAASTMVWARW